VTSGAERLGLYLFGAVAGVVGGGAVGQGIRGGRGCSFLSQLLVLSFGVAFTVCGVLHLAEHIGLPWATPTLRGQLYLCFFVLCLIVWIAVWFSVRRSHRR